MFSSHSFNELSIVISLFHEEQQKVQQHVWPLAPLGWVTCLVYIIRCRTTQFYNNSGRWLVASKRKVLSCFHPISSPLIHAPSSDLYSLIWVQLNQHRLSSPLSLSRSRSLSPSLPHSACYLKGLSLYNSPIYLGRYADMQERQATTRGFSVCLSFSLPRLSCSLSLSLSLWSFL